ncbi:MAG: hypothetical protein PVG32_09455 [Anaerolineales bacterium]|jgi:hypothetical protein
MKSATKIEMSKYPVHPWLRKINLAYVPGNTSPLLEKFSRSLLNYFEKFEHRVTDSPKSDTDLILTSAQFGDILDWREALLFTSRIRFKLEHSPTVITIVHATPDEFSKKLAYFASIIAKDEPDPEDYQLPGLAPDAYRVLHEQGSRGGPILALERLLQGQVKSIRILLLIGEDTPDEVYHFDLVGAYPRSVGINPDEFYSDIVLRIVTGMSTHEITEHRVIGDLIPRNVWDKLSTPHAMRIAAKELGKRSFFTEMVRIADLVKVPAVDASVSSQYSEGCFATWDPELNALIATVTGSARPVEKDNISEADLAVIVGIRENGQGAKVLHVKGKQNDPPSSEAVELMDMDYYLPTILWDDDPNNPGEVPVVRSKLHGHRGIASYKPDKVEYVPLDRPYFHFPVSCATEAQAKGIKAAFSRSEALNNPDDPRQVAFTILPCHGVVIAEKWVSGKDPFQVIWEYMDDGSLEIDPFVPQGPMTYLPGKNGRKVINNFDQQEWTSP